MPAVSLEAQEHEVVADKDLWYSVTGPVTDYSYASLSALVQQSGPPAHSVVGFQGAVVTAIRLQNQSPEHLRWFLVFNANFIDKGVAYWKPEQGAAIALTEYSQLAGQGMPHLLHYQAISLPVKAGSEGTLLLYAESQQYAYPFSLKILPEPDFNHYQFLINNVSVMTISVMLTLAAIALLLYFRTGYSVTLACAGYIGLHGIGWAAASGLINDGLRLSMVNTAYGGIYIFPFAIACACQFTRLLFECTRIYPRLSAYLNGLSLLCLGLGALLPWLAFWQAFWSSHLVATVWVFTSLSVGIFMLSQEGYRARYYLLGNAIYAAALVYYMLSHVMSVTYDVYPELIVLAALATDCFCILLSLTEWLQQQKREYRRSYYHARVDPLTQVGNRYAFNERQRQLKKYHLLVFLDLDGMKKVNDQRGHDQGDLMLQRVAHQMQQILKGSGEVFRTGGDEFIWLTDSNQSQPINQFAQGIPERVARIEQHLQSAGWPEVGISSGYATSHETGSLSECLALADRRMYEDKQRKRALSASKETMREREIVTLAE